MNVESGWVSGGFSFSGIRSARAVIRLRKPKESRGIPIKEDVFLLALSAF